MKLSPDQIEQIMEILNKHTAVYIGTTMGEDFLSNREKVLLSKAGIDWKKLYRESKDPLFMQFQLGAMSQVLGVKSTENITFERMKTMIEERQYIPLNERERRSLDNIKRQALSDIKAVNNRIFQDVNNIILESERNKREAYEQVVREEIEAGMYRRQSIKEISQNLANRTGDYDRDFKKIVEYTSHLAFDEGRAAVYDREENDPKVYKNVYSGACKHCVRLYLTGGIGSRPIIFKLSELRANGTNIGRKVNEYRPVIGSVHPHCRCTLEKLRPGEDWDNEKGGFVFEGEVEPSIKRRKYAVQVGNKRFMA